MGHLNNRIYQHEVIVHQQQFVDSVHADIHTETIEGLWMLVKRKQRYQAGTSRGLFASDLAEFQWRHEHKEHVFGKYLEHLCNSYNT